MTQAKEDAFDVDGHDAIKHVLVILRGRRDAAFDTGIVMETIDRAVSVERGFDMVSELFTESALQFKRDHAGEDYERADLLGAIGDAYIELLATNRPKLMFQLQAYAACEDEVIRERVSAAYARLGMGVREVTGADENELNEFLSHGMWLNVQAALQLMDLEVACEWIKERRELNRAADQPG